jgi:membrane protease YdiL (CAAX protease family)
MLQAKTSGIGCVKSIAKPGLGIILSYLCLHEVWRRFIFGDNVFVFLRTLFMIGVAVYCRGIAPDIRLAELFGVGKLNLVSAKVLAAFLPLCVGFRILFHYEFVLPTGDFIHLMTESGINFGSFLSNCVIAPVNEELLFRGLFLSILLSKLKEPSVFAIVLSALVFANCHDIDGRTFIVTFTLGIILGCAYQCSRSVVVCAILHLAWNVMIFIPLPK